MSIPRIAMALEYIDDELIDGAQKSVPVKRFNWTRWATMAACVCIACGAALILADNRDSNIPDTDIQGEVTTSVIDNGNEASSVITEDYTVNNSFENTEDRVMEEFGRDFLEMYFRALDLNEPYDFDEYIDIPLLKKYVDMLVERRQFNNELFGAPDHLDYTIDINMTKSEKLDDCYRLTYSVVTEYTYPGSDFRSGQGEGMYLLIREKGEGYELVGMQYTVKDGYFTGDRWGDTWEEQRSFLVSDPKYWVNESEEEMLGWFEQDRQAAIATAEKQQQAQAEADAKKPITIQEGLEAEILEVIERHNRYLLYAERDDAVGLDYSDKYNYGGIDYFLVTNEEIDEWQELQNLIDSIFCDGHSKEKHTVKDVFTEVDGKTYRRKTGNKKTETAPIYLRSYHDDGKGNVSVLAGQDQNNGKTYISIQYNFHYEEEIGWRMSGYDAIAH